MEDRYLSEKESMVLITSMINKAKNQVSENGTLYIIWGWVILVCCTVQFLSEQFFHYPQAYYIWFSTYAALLFQIVYLIRKKKSGTAKTYTEEINGFVWMAFAIGAILMVFISIRAESVQLILPLLLIFYGIPTFLSGTILKFRPLIAGGSFCWVLAIISTFVPHEYQLLLLAAAVLSAWLIPGYLLKIKYKKAS